MFMQTNKMETQISEIKKWATEGIPAIVADTNCDLKTYFQKGRLVLNLMLIEALIGAEIRKDEGEKAKGDYKIKFNKPLPTASELAEISSIVDTFIATVETPFISRFTSPEPDDMSIPVPMATGSSIRLEKINNKTMKDLIFGGGADAMTNRMINVIDCIQLAAIGAELRAKTIRNRVLIVGGIALVITTGAIIGYNMYKKSHTENDEEPVEDPIVEIGDDDLPDVSIDDAPDADAPVVSID